MEKRKPINSPDEADQTFTAGDLKRLIGLTYRQLNDWESRAGVLVSGREGNEGWRKFTAEHMLALAVCSALRRQFSLPLDKLGELRRWLMGVRKDRTMLHFAKEGENAVKGLEECYSDLFLLKKAAWKKAMEDDFNQFVFREYAQAKLDMLRVYPIRYAFQSVNLFGSTIYLHTDCDDVYTILFEKNLTQALALGTVKKPTIIMPLNEVFDEINAELGRPPIERETLGAPYSEEFLALNEREEVTEDEMKVLLLIRETAYRRVTLLTNQGKVIRAEVEGEVLDAEQLKKAKLIADAVSAGNFSTVSVQQTNGNVVRLIREETIKFAKATGKT